MLALTVRPKCRGIFSDGIPRELDWAAKIHRPLFGTARFECTAGKQHDVL